MELLLLRGLAIITPSGVTWDEIPSTASFSSFPLVLDDNLLLSTIIGGILRGAHRLATVYFASTVE